MVSGYRIWSIKVNVQESQMQFYIYILGGVRVAEKMRKKEMVMKIENECVYLGLVL